VLLDRAQFSDKARGQGVIVTAFARRARERERERKRENILRVFSLLYLGPSWAKSRATGFAKVVVDG